MNDPQFHQEYLCKPTEPTDAEIRLRELAMEYHERVETYDRSVCTCRTQRGIAMPANLQERMLITQNAKNIHDELSVEAEILGFDLKQWRNAIADAGKI